MLVVLLLISSPCALRAGPRYLTVNGLDVNDVEVVLGEPVTIEINSTDSFTYLNLIGFEVETLLYDLQLLEIRLEAGAMAAADPVYEPGVMPSVSNSTTRTRR